MTVPNIEPGQVWRTRAVGEWRRVSVESADDYANDPTVTGQRVTVRNVATGRVSQLFAATLRRSWSIEPPTEAGGIQR